MASAKGKRRPCMTEAPLPSPVGYNDRADLNEAMKHGIYRASEGRWFDMRKMRLLTSEETRRFDAKKEKDKDKKKEPGIKAYLSR